MKRDGEWRITYYARGGGETLIHWPLKKFFPDGKDEKILNDHDAVEEIKEIASKIIKDELNNRKSKFFCETIERFNPEFGLAWVESIKL